MLKDKVLISFCTLNSPWFLENFISSFEQHNPGYDFDLLIIDHNSDNVLQNKLLDIYSKKYNIAKRENKGRSQGAYNFAWNNNKDYKYYFFLHEDCCFIKDNWLKIAIDRINDSSLEYYLDNIDEIKKYPVGKVGFNGYEWCNKIKTLKSGFDTLTYSIDIIEKNMGIKIPQYYQWINDDKILYRNELLKEEGIIWSTEYFKSIENGDVFNGIYGDFERKGLNSTLEFKPYGCVYNTFQTISEFLNITLPMRNKYRTHVVFGDGYCQEILGWRSFWGNDYIVHYGDHVVFKTLAAILNQDEGMIRNRFKDKTFLRFVANFIKQNTKVK